MIVSFKDKNTKDLANGIRVKEFVPFERVARRKLLQLKIAQTLNDLRIPPGNHLEQLKGNRSDTYSIRINAKMRICFKWTDFGAEDVEITDYH